MDPPVQVSDASAVSAHMTRNRRDSDGSPIPELGWRVALWNGQAVSFSACVGAYAPNQTNSVVISFAPGSTEPRQQEQEEVLQLMIDHFDPDHAVATSNALLDRQGVSLPWEAGWLRYMRGGHLRSEFVGR